MLSLSTWKCKGRNNSFEIWSISICRPICVFFPRMISPLLILIFHYVPFNLSKRLLRNYLCAWQGKGIFISFIALLLHIKYLKIVLNNHHLQRSESIPFNFFFVLHDICVHYTALLWQKEASDIPSKSELLMCLYFYPVLLFFQAKSYA